MLIGLEGRFHLIQERKGVIIRDEWFKNKITLAGKENLLDVFFKKTSHMYAGFYMGLLDNTFTDFSNNTPTITGEFQTYTEGARRTITFDAPTVDTTYAYIQNSTSNFCVFTVDAAVVDQLLNGIFITDVATLGGATTRLYCTAAFGNTNTAVPITVNTADVIRLQYMARIALGT